MTGADAAAQPHGDRLKVAAGLIREFEGLRTTAYKCPSGSCTVGYGHTGSDVHYGLTITRSRADQLLDRDLRAAAGAAERMVTAPLSEQAFGALISWIFNVGAGAAEDSTLIFLLNQKKYEQAADQFGKWTKIRVGDRHETSAGLSRRRQAERAAFLKGVE